MLRGCKGRSCSFPFRLHCGRIKPAERVTTTMQPRFFQTAECGMKTQRFLEGERKKTVLGELHNKVSEREIERTFKLQTSISSFCIANVIYDKLKELSCKDAFSL